MSFCEHCEGQRFDRAQVLRALRSVERRLLRSHGRTSPGHEALRQAIRAVRALEIPHLEHEDEVYEDEIVH